MAGKTGLDAAQKVLTLENPDSDASSELGPVDSLATPSSQNALARFEFETGRGNEGTKILMVEWSPAAECSTGGTAQKEGQHKDQIGWDVSWEGKKTTFPLSEREGNASHRVYFLIPARVTIPPVITISQTQTGQKVSTKPMPAIFAPALRLDTENDGGKRDVLHTMWAKKRLSQLQEEIRLEMQNNSEGVGLEMAVQERLWIIEHFGLEPAKTSDRPRTGEIPPTPRIPRSPIGDRLGEKLRGLKLATNTTDLASSPSIGSHKHHHLYSFSPDASDIAVPSRSALSQATAAAKASVGVGGPGLASLDAFMGGNSGVMTRERRETEDELFALPLSPRSPEMKKSPFSFLKS